MHGGLIQGKSILVRVCEGSSYLESTVDLIPRLCCDLFPANSFQCYKCGPKNVDESYTTDQCEKDQKKVDCNSTAGMLCMKGHSTKDDGIEFETRSCTYKVACENGKKMCGNAEEREKQKIKECQVACCETDLCNGAFITSGNMAMMMTMMMIAAMCSLVLF